MKQREREKKKEDDAKKTFLGKGKSMSKVSEVKKNLVCSRSRKEAKELEPASSGMNELDEVRKISRE